MNWLTHLETGFPAPCPELESIRIINGVSSFAPRRYWSSEMNLNECAGTTRSSWSAKPEVSFKVLWKRLTLTSQDQHVRILGHFGADIVKRWIAVDVLEFGAILLWISVLLGPGVSDGEERKSNHVHHSTSRKWESKAKANTDIFTQHWLEMRRKYPDVDYWKLPPAGHHSIGHWWLGNLVRCNYSQLATLLHWQNHQTHSVCSASFPLCANLLHTPWNFFFNSRSLIQWMFLTLRHGYWPPRRFHQDSWQKTFPADCSWAEC